MICAAMLLLTGHVQAKDYKYETVASDPMQTRIYTLDNGLKVYLSANSEKPRIQTFIAVRTGSKNDPAETTGLAHYLEHIMFKGTKQFGTIDPEAETPLLDEIEAKYEEYRRLKDVDERRKKYHEIDSISQLAAQYFIPNEYDKLMAAIGAEGTNAYTSNDVTCYTEDIPSNEIENWARVQSDRFQNMVIRGFHTELEAVYEEYNIGLAKDQNKLFHALMAKLYPTHPYGTQTTIGTQEHLKNPSIVNIKNYFNHWYVPNNVAICMSGDLDPDKTIATIDKYFSSWKPGADVNQPIFPALAPITSPQDTTIIGQEAEAIWLGWRFDRGNSLQMDTLELIGDLLSNAKAGLFDIDLNQQMKVLAAYAGLETLADHSFFVSIGMPKEGQTLDEVRTLMLGEIDKLKKGDFSDNLLPATINNMKLHHYRELESNRSRADMYVNAFINDIPWEQEVKKIDRISAITKQQVMDFVARHFVDNYVAVYKRQGVDTTQKKIEKPVITPIPANRDRMSAFVKEIQETKVEPIQPRFVDFNRDMTISKTSKNIPLLYKQNTENGLFTLDFHYKFGSETDNRYPLATDYLDYLGTKKLTAAQVKEQFYKLACDYDISVSNDRINVQLSGLNENMSAALALLEDLLQNARVDEEAYGQYISLLLKARNDAKTNQNANFSALKKMGIYGEYNSQLNDLSAEQLRNTRPQDLLDLLKNLSGYEHTILYYGATTEKELSNIIAKNHKTPKTLTAVPEGKPYMEQTADKNEVYIAPYDAKNIYMMMYHNENRPWDVKDAAVKELFNEYFGTGMNGVVFQEMRETRGLAYHASASYVGLNRPNHPEYYFTYIITQNDKMMDCINAFNSILDNMPTDENAFHIAKDALTKQLASKRTTKFGVLSAYLNAQRYGLDADLDQKVYEQLPSLKLQDIVDFERSHMAGKQYRYIILGDEKELDMKSLEKLGTVKRFTTEDIFGY